MLALHQNEIGVVVFEPAENKYRIQFQEYLKPDCFLTYTVPEWKELKGDVQRLGTILHDEIHTHNKQLGLRIDQMPYGWQKLMDLVVYAPEPELVYT
ncbi:MAG: hypothetical protein HYU64_07785 [Armatimonadetes bacterium]|nr:hypothetical protein [Armatimonadota bacterium]